MQVIHEAAGRPFTYKYSQPADYHFCLDSIVFPYWLASELRPWLEARSARIDPSPRLKVADVGAGCGVLGLELNYFLPELNRIDFFEVQSAFANHFEFNASQSIALNRVRAVAATSLASPAMCVDSTPTFQFVQQSSASMPSSHYDLVISNPPYFLPTEGKLSPSEIRNRARFFLDRTQMEFLNDCVGALKPGGRAYLLWKSGEEHGRTLNEFLSLSEIQEWREVGLTLSVPVRIRTTHVLQIDRRST